MWCWHCWHGILGTERNVMLSSDCKLKPKQYNNTIMDHKCCKCSKIEIGSNTEGFDLSDIKRFPSVEEYNKRR